MLKAPSARKEVGRRDSTKRNSKEIKDFMVETSMKDITLKTNKIRKTKMKLWILRKSKMKNQTQVKI